MTALSGRAWACALSQSRRLRRSGCGRAQWSAEVHTAAARWSPGQPPPKAAALVIGNEVLSGKIQDTNTAWLARLLYARGVDLVRVEVVPDVPEDIAATARSLSARVGPTGFVFSSGGIGPTHDDVRSPRQHLKSLRALPDSSAAFSNTGDLRVACCRLWGAPGTARANGGQDAGAL